MNAGPGGRRWHWYTVPAGTRYSACRGCSARVYWIVGPKGTKLPVDCDTVDGSQPPSAPSRDPEAQRTQWDGVGVSHFQTCTAADRFGKGGRR